MICHYHHVGVGNVVLQVASTVNCKECIGIEKAEIPSGYAQVRNCCTESSVDVIINM